MNKEPNVVIHLEQAIRDGVLYLSSKDLPGLWLWGKDREQVFSNVAPTIAKLFELNEGKAVEIKEACPKDTKSRWFGGGRVCDTFEVYYVNKLVGENVTHVQTTME
jgi:hypothetical protein